MEPPPSMNLMDNFVPPTQSVNQFGRLDNRTMNDNRRNKFDNGLDLDADFSSNSRSTQTVRVFGFPPHEINRVLQEFQSIGTLEFDLPKDGRNWVDFTYQTPEQAKQALSKSGTTIGSGIMIGVIAGKQKGVFNFYFWIFFFGSLYLLIKNNNQLVKNTKAIQYCIKAKKCINNVSVFNYHLQNLGKNH